jgi:butyrate kinase
MEKTAIQELIVETKLEEEKGSFSYQIAQNLLIKERKQIEDAFVSGIMCSSQKITEEALKKSVERIDEMIGYHKTDKLNAIRKGNEHRELIEETTIKAYEFVKELFVDNFINGYRNKAREYYISKYNDKF